MPSPRLEKNSRNSSGWARPSTSGPTTIPSTISSTTTGTAKRGAISPAAKAAMAPTVTTVRKDSLSTEIIAGAGPYDLRRRRRVCAPVPTIYVTGHQNPDADSIASAIGYAELKSRLDPRNEYVPVRLGELNAQSSWLIEKSGAPLPDFLPHVFLRVCDVMRESFPTARHDEPVREVGLTMAREGLDLVPIVNDEELVGVMTERALARRYIRESRGASRLDAPTAVGAIVGGLQGRLVTGDRDREIAGRVWVLAMDVSSPTRMEAGDVVVVGDRPDVQRRALERGAALLVTSNDTDAPDDVLELARERDACMVSSSLDSYVTARMITLAAPCHALMDADPLTV